MQSLLFNIKQQITQPNNQSKKTNNYMLHLHVNPCNTTFKMHCIIHDLIHTHKHLSPLQSVSFPFPVRQICAYKHQLVFFSSLFFPPLLTTKLFEPLACQSVKMAPGLAANPAVWHEVEDGRPADLVPTPFICSSGNFWDECKFPRA